MRFDAQPSTIFIRRIDRILSIADSEPFLIAGKSLYRQSVNLDVVLLPRLQDLNRGHRLSHPRRGRRDLDYSLVQPCKSLAPVFGDCLCQPGFGFHVHTPPESRGSHGGSSLLIERVASRTEGEATFASTCPFLKVHRIEPLLRVLQPRIKCKGSISVVVFEVTPPWVGVEAVGPNDWTLDMSGENESQQHDNRILSVRDNWNRGDQLARSPGCNV